jgi:outer membrane PBP1 activator LpoA protein
MQRHFSVLSWVSLLVGALYVSVPASATAEELAPAPAPAVTPAEPPVPHIALILPLKSPSFAKAADVIKQGFMAAASREKRGLPVRVYPCTNEEAEVPGLYQQALQSGAVVVAGPITRNGVTALANAYPVMTTPTLALNTLDVARDDQLYFYALPPEAEARQSAQRATAAGWLSVIIVSTNTPLSKRLAQAYADEWQRAGGILRAEIVWNGDATPLKEISDEPGNSVFLAAETDKARLLRPYINISLPVYATSQIFSGNTNAMVNYDLSDVRFVDMPWLLQPDHPAVMIYPRSATPLSPELERLYALGIDSYRLLQVLYHHDFTNLLPLDGVTGKISINGHQFQREAALAIMRQGQGMVLEGKQRQ